MENLNDNETTFSLDQLLADLKGLGIYESGTPVPIPTTSGSQIILNFKNISTEEEITSLLSAEEFKGHQWMQRIKCEILSKAVSQINGHPININTIVPNPSNPEELLDVHRVLRAQMLSWGPELLQVVWKIYMVHCQNVENKLLDQFPESAVMTEYEQQFYKRTMEMMAEISQDMVSELESEDN